ncbi:MAG: CpaD family pilus assembly protein [Pseudomonadota bacterium]|nr:CpaD family pilus assembly protein [Pseudomonadota bacterium]
MSPSPAIAPRRLAVPPLSVRLAAVAVLTGVLSACGNVHHIEVGSIPDDYRTRHPIIVSEAEQAIDITVVASDSNLPHSDVSRVQDFANRFLTSGADSMRVLIPYGARNSVAAGRLLPEIRSLLSRSYVEPHRIVVESYAAHDALRPTPIRLSFSTLVAKTTPCGSWPDDLTDTAENKNYHNFGCATQQNLAAQIADPRDLLSPRGMGPVDSQRRSTIIEKYRKGEKTGASEPKMSSDYSW